MRAREASSAAGGDADGMPLASVEHEGVAALVSPVADGGVRLGRDNVVAHADVLQAAFERGPVLPLRFGTVLKDEQEVIGQLLAPTVGRLSARLDLLEGKAEMQLKGIYLEEPLLRSILSANPALARSVRRMQGQPAAATHFERIRIGEVVAAAVQARRAADEAELLGALSAHALAVSVSEPHHERSALNAAFLVDREKLGQFDTAVERVTEARAADTQFKLIGPLPPYSFADRDWEAASSKEVTGSWA